MPVKTPPEVEDWRKQVLEAIRVLREEGADAVADAIQFLLDDHDMLEEKLADNISN